MEEIPQPSTSSDRPKRRKTPNSKYFGGGMVSSQKSRKTDTEKTESNITHETRQISSSDENESAEANVLQKGNKLTSSDIQKTRENTESSDENESIVFVGDLNVKSKVIY